MSFSEKLRVLRESEEAVKLQKEAEKAAVEERACEEKQKKALKEFKIVYPARLFLKEQVLPIIKTTNKKYLLEKGGIYKTFGELLEFSEQALKDYQNAGGMFNSPKIELYWDQPGRHSLTVGFSTIENIVENEIYLKAGNRDKFKIAINTKGQGWEEELKSGILKILESPEVSFCEAGEERSENLSGS